MSLNMFSHCYEQANEEYKCSYIIRQLSGFRCGIGVWHFLNENKQQDYFIKLNTSNLL